MKKLMIAAAIVCAAVVSQAAQWDWKTSDSVLSNPSGSAYKDATVYLIEAIGATSITDKTAQNALLDAFQNSATRAATVSGLSGQAFRTGTTDKNGKLAEDIWTDSTPDGLTKYFYVVAVSEDSTAMYISMNAKVGTQKDDKFSTITTVLTPSINVQDATGKADFNLPGWYAVASVPEPTSGLLLLLGVAGLALRRRRA